jgi:hypothetical protein
LQGFSEHVPLDDAADVVVDELELVVVELEVVAKPVLELAEGEPPVDEVMPPEPEELAATVGVPVFVPPTPAPPTPRFNGPEPVAQAVVSAAVTRRSGDERMGKPPQEPAVKIRRKLRRRLPAFNVSSMFRRAPVRRARQALQRNDLVKTMRIRPGPA